MDQQSRQRLAQKVRALRDNTSQVEFAKTMGVRQSTIASWEKATNVPTLENIEKLAELSKQLPEEFLANIYGRTISTQECPTVAFAITTMDNQEIGCILMLIGQHFGGELPDDIEEKKLD
ncbi:helix-turn-helix domain-containing protein [Pseudanabaena minima]|uniref:helix-turn-helix domain-containing protein n=1 Tax=Pseudanabaena minima TaxID=890415 RepID=UPI003DA883DC